MRLNCGFRNHFDRMKKNYQSVTSDKIKKSRFRKLAVLMRLFQKIICTIKHKLVATIIRYQCKSNFDNNTDFVVQTI